MPPSSFRISKIEKTFNKSKSIFYNLDEKEEDVAISYGEENQEAKEVEIPETRVKKNPIICRICLAL